MTKTFEQKYNALLNSPEMLTVAPDNHCETSEHNGKQIEHFRPFPNDDDNIADLLAAWQAESDKENSEFEFDTSQFDDEDDFDEGEAFMDALERNLDWTVDCFKRTWRTGITYREWSEATRLEVGLFLNKKEFYTRFPNSGDDTKATS
jgi:hypothetical protein